MRLALVAVACLSLVACASVTPLFTGAVFVLMFALGFAANVRAGAPVPCQGSTHESCDGTYIQRTCCPLNAPCNYRNRPYVSCGDGYCAHGADLGRCPVPQAHVIDSAQCAKDGFVKACINHAVKDVCLMSVPTNYTGPSRNPAFIALPDGRCTTSRFVEEAYPVRNASAKCDGAWTRVCLGGKVEERCLPKTAPDGHAFQATKYVTCKDKSCAVGDDKSACE